MIYPIVALLGLSVAADRCPRVLVCLFAILAGALALVETLRIARHARAINYAAERKRGHW